MTPAHTDNNAAISRELQLSAAFEILIRVAPPYELGEIGGERRRMIAIVGGELQGPAMSGSVLAGGADWQTLSSDGVTHLHAKYAIQMCNGDIVQVDNRGLRRAAPDVANRMVAGVEVDHSQYYFVTTPMFEVAPGPHYWLREHVFLARGLRFPDRIRLRVFRVD